MHQRHNIILNQGGQSRKKSRDDYQNGIKFAKPSVTKLPATNSVSTWLNLRSDLVGSIMPIKKKIKSRDGRLSKWNQICQTISYKASCNEIRLNMAGR